MTSPAAGAASGLPDALLLVVGHMAHQPPPSVKVASSCPHPFRIVATCRTGRWFRERGFTKPLRSPDRDFDARWSVETDDVEFGEALVRLPAARAAVAALAASGCQSVTQCRKRLTAVLPEKQRKAMKDPAFRAPLEAQLATLAGLSAGLLRTRSYPHRTGHAWLFRGALLVAVLLLGVAFTALALWAPELVSGGFARLALRSLVVGLPLGIALLAAVAVPLAGRSTSHKELGVLALVLLPAVATACFGAAIAANRLLDPGPATQHRVPVLERRERRSENKLHGYWAIVPDWRRPSDGAAAGPEAAAPTIRIRFDRSTGEAIVPGETTLLVRVSPGGLGEERLLSKLVEPPAR